MLSGLGRIVIYGAGGIGCTIGGHLTLAGYEVLLIGRPGHIDQINRNGLRFINPNGTFVLKIAGYTSPGCIAFQPSDLVFLTTKSQDTETAMQDLNKAADDVPVFSFQNGVRNEETIGRYFPRVYGAMIRIGAEYVKDGEVIVRRDPPGWVIASRYPQGKDELLESVAAALRRAGFLAMVVENALPYKWGKLLLNLSNAIGAITNQRGPETARISTAAQAEAEALLRQAGIPWVTHEETQLQWPEIREQPRKTLETQERSSTWQSLTRRQGSVETEHLNGEIVRLAAQLGLEAPVNAGLLQISAQMAKDHELPGKYSAVELEKILRIP
jgi:2-dehydropantoate 2-reductase